MGSYDSIEDERFYGAIGRLAIAWAHLEFSLDCMVEAIHWALGGNEIEPEIPRALSRKLTYLRTNFKRFKIPEEAQQTYLELFDEIRVAGETRHDFIHGIVVDQVEKSGEATFSRVIRRKNNVTKREFTATTRDILVAARTAQKLNKKTWTWVSRAYDLFDELAERRDKQKPS
jgi:hypothetical protein